MGKEDEGVIIHRIITDKDFVYINDVSTDVLRTFKKMGWIPPSELKRIKAEEDAALDQFQEEKDNG
jgi:transglutaminase-like putative cysteine protease